MSQKILFVRNFILCGQALRTSDVEDLRASRHDNLRPAILIIIIITSVYALLENMRFELFTCLVQLQSDMLCELTIGDLFACKSITFFCLVFISHQFMFLIRRFVLVFILRLCLDFLCSTFDVTCILGDRTKW